MVSIWLLVLLLAIPYDHMIMYVGLFGHSAVVFHAFMFFMFFVFYWLFVWFCFFSDILLIYSAASPFNKLSYLLAKRLTEVTYILCRVERKTLLKLKFKTPMSVTTFQNIRVRNRPVGLRLFQTQDK